MENSHMKNASHRYLLWKYKLKLQWKTILYPPDRKYKFENSKWYEDREIISRSVN